MNIFQDYGEFEDSKILLDDDKYLVVSAVIASEIVQAYRDRMGKTYFAYKSADELEKAVWTANGRWVKALSHPKSDQIYDAADINGVMENARFRRDLIDPKTRRPCRRGIQVDVRWFKNNAPEVKAGTATAISDSTADAIRRGTLKDNSIGFKSCMLDPTPGEFNGQHYDVIQRRLVIDHLAAPIERGRCPSPYFGIAVDSEAEKDMWEETENSIRSGHGSDNVDKDSFRTIDITEGIKAVVACPTGKYENGHCTVSVETQSFIFDKSKFDLSKAKAWFNKHQDTAADELRIFYDCPVCRRIDEIGMLTVGQRLFKQYGADVLEVIEGNPIGQTSVEDKDSTEKLNLEKDSQMQLNDVDKEIIANKQALKNLNNLIELFP